jgi:argininosuccinate lyase
MKLWEKGIESNEAAGDFTAGKDRELDLQLAPYDILGSIAHVRMLESIGLLSGKELSSLVNELKKLHGKAVKGEFFIDEGIEDVHSQVEILLTDALGDTGKKVHTARSRNDQVLLDLKLFARARIEKTVIAVKDLFDRLIALSELHREILMPGYTHMQIAMPSSFGLWFGAYAESLHDDMILLQAAWKLTNQNPLGSAAGYGSSFPVDRRLTTDMLGFDHMHVNVINAQMNRGKMEKAIAFALGSIGSTLARMAMDTCLFSGRNFGFLSLPDEFTTGSSIMPHKKNPDVFELIRAKGNKLQALPYEISLVTTNLPSGYHRDLQLIKEAFIPSFDILLEMLSITKLLITGIKVNPDIVSDSLYQDIFSVEEVNRLVMKGIPFREAYKIVAGAIQNGEYKPDRQLDHTHEGSLGNLCNDIIREKMNVVISGFDFQKAEIAIRKLLE